MNGYDERLHPLVEEIHEIFKKYSENSARQQWAQHVQEDVEFRYGKQWTAEQRAELESRGQAAIVVNRIHPAVETAKALLTSKRPKFKASAREDSDTKVANVIDGLFEYIWDISNGQAEFRQIIDDYYVKSMGYALVYQDPMADNGKGEVKFMHLDPLDVYVDPNSRMRDFSDAENIIYSRLYTKEQAANYKPLYSDEFLTINGDSYSDRPVTDREDDGEVSFPESSEISEDTEKIRGYERYQMILTYKYRIFEKMSGQEKLLTKEEYIKYVQQPAWIINGSVYLNQNDVQQMANIIAQKTGQQPEIQQITYLQLVANGMITVVPVRVKNIRLISVMGDKLLYVRELPSNLHNYPIIPFPNLYTGTPFPTSDVRMVKGLQEYINKIRSLIIAHASTSTNVKVLLPKGSVDMETFEQEWARPGVGIEVDFDLGEPKPVQPVPLPTELYANERAAKNDINHQFGIYEMMAGDSQAAPNTYKATISLDEYGQRKIRSKLADIETSLLLMGKVMLPFIQQLYRTEKIFRVIQPNNSINEYAINKRLVDDKTKEIKVINDISRGNYDIKIVTGASLPSNRYAELDLHMEAYKVGLIDRVEVLKKTDIYDKEGILQRIDTIEQLKSQIRQLGQTVKALKGDLETREREVYHAKQAEEIAKFKASLKGVTTEAKAAGQLYQERLKDSQREFERENKRKLKEDKPR